MITFVQQNFSQLLTAVFTLVALVAAVVDYQTGKIPNVLTFSALFFGLVVSTMALGIDGFIAALLGVLVGFVLFFPLFLTGVMGAGDGKLVMALGTALGPWDTGVLTVWSLLVGGLASLFIVIKRGRIKIFVKQIYKFLRSLLTPGLELDWPTLDKASKAPFGIAIFVGFIIVRWSL